MSGKMRILLFALLCLVLFRNNSYADGDFSSMSDEELLCVQTELNAEITKRGLIKQIELPPGIYEAGVDIPVGKYVVTAIKESSGIAPIVRVFKNKEIANEQAYKLVADDVIMDEFLDEFGICTIDLQEGYVLVLRSTTYSIQKFQVSSF